VVNDTAAREPVLRFEKPLVIVGGGDVDFSLLRSLYAGGAHIIGADGGGDVCAQAGITPEAIIGDIDSLDDPVAWAEKTRLIRIEEQLTTDFEKCLYSTAAPITVAMGMTGKRFDHTLAALSAVMRYGKDRQIVLADETDIALVVNGSITFTVDAGARVSLHPLGRVAFVGSKGLDYPLEDVVLEPGGRTGASNSATTGVFEVHPEPDQAAWLLILDLKYLPVAMKRLA